MVTKSILVVIVVLLLYFGYQAYMASPIRGSFQLPFMPKQNMTIKSSAFSEGAMIPSRYTCDGQNVNPPLNFYAIPPFTKSLVLIVTDPDSSSGTFTHWILYNISPLENNTPENSLPKDSGTIPNDFGNPGYGGPCPLIGIHHYVFTLYALDTYLNLPSDSKKADLENSIQNHILATAKLTGIYERKASQ